MNRGKNINKPKSESGANSSLEGLLGKIDTKLFVIIILLVGALIVAIADL